jgi:hypothetical protein
MPPGSDPVPDQDFTLYADLPAIALLHDLTRWREQLARSIARNNLALRSEVIATAVNRIIVRALILRIAEDRGLIPLGFMQEIYSADNQYPKFLDLFPGDCDPWSDSEVPRASTDVPLAALVIDTPVIESILTRLIEPDLPYDFSSMTTEAVAQVLLQYLKRTIRRSAAHQAAIVDTHDTAITGGIPDPTLPVIEYLVQATLDAAMAGRSRREILPLRILDPACGTGLPLLVAYRYLIDRHGGSGLLFDERREILRQSLHGVDIDRNAIALTKFLLIFRFLEGEQESLAFQHVSFFELVPDLLRDLFPNIRCGNALIGPDIVDDESWAFCSPRERHSLNLFLWNDNFPEIVSAGGFDAVLGNPPGGLPEPKEWTQQYLQRHYASYHQKADRSAFFVECGVRHLRRGGSLGYVMSDRFLRSQAGSPLRAFLKTEQPEEIVIFSSLGNDRHPQDLCVVRLSHVPMSHCMYAALVDPTRSVNIAEAVMTHRFPVDLSGPAEIGWTLRDTRRDSLLNKIKRRGTPLEEIVMGPVHEGIAAGYDSLFSIDAETRWQLVKEDPGCKPFIRPVITGQVLVRYGTSSQSRFLVFVPQGWTHRHPAAESSPWRWFKRRYPSLARYLKTCADKAKSQTGQGELWWETPCDPDLFLEKHRKIFFRKNFESPAFSYDEGRSIPDPATGFFYSSNLYLLGVLNSRLVAYVFRAMCLISGRNRRLYTWDDLQDLPVYTPDLDDPADEVQHNQMIGLVKRRLELERQVSGVVPGPRHGRLQKEIDITEGRIDELVYALYGLTADEIAVIKSTET